eukprot:951293-Prymnesium_polylepis.1
MRPNGQSCHRLRTAHRAERARRLPPPELSPPSYTSDGGRHEQAADNRARQQGAHADRLRHQ